MRAEAWFYLGASYGARAQWRSLRGEQVAAARDGKRIKESLERAARARPGDCTTRATASASTSTTPTWRRRWLKLLRWLLLLPGGDRPAGLRRWKRRARGRRLVRSEADYQLHLVYLWYERDPERALVLVRELRATPPAQPRTFSRWKPTSTTCTARIRWPACRSGAAWPTPREADRVAHPDAAAARARLGMAVQLDRLGDTDLAIDQLRTLLASSAAAPVGIEAERAWRWAAELDRMGARTEAVAQYKAGLAAVPSGDPFAGATRRATGCAAPRRRHGPGLSPVARRLARARARRAAPRPPAPSAGPSRCGPRDPATRYRHARLQLAERHTGGRRGTLEAVISDPATPPHVFAGACYHAARALEQQGSLPRAIELYRLVVDAFGVDPVLKAEAQRALAASLGVSSVAVERVTHAHRASAIE